MKALHPGIPVSLILAAALSRIIPHPANFTPLVAIALFGSVYFNGKSTAFLAPIVVMFLSDAVLWRVHGYDLFSVMRIVVYSSFFLITALGMLTKRFSLLPRIAFGATAGSLLFFFITNFFVWSSWTLYPDTFEGLLACYVAAIPFLGNMLAGSFVYSILLFGGVELLKRRYPMAVTPVAHDRVCS
jgi:hypothetical protein